MSTFTLRHIAAGAAALLTLLAAGLTSCKDSNTWTVEGNIKDTDSRTLFLEAFSNGRWYMLDSVTPKSNGRFAFTQPATPYPDIFRLRLDDRTLYFPVDSIETVSVTTSANAFDTDYTLAGSDNAITVMDVDRMLRDCAGAPDSLLKRDLSQILLSDPSGIVSYYIINKKVGGKPLFNPADKRDLGLIGAVANAYIEKRPGDPRTEYLRKLYLNHFSQRVKAAGNFRPDTIVAGEVAMFDISLYDETGKPSALSDLLDQNKTVLLNFTAYGSENSPAFNAALNKVYDKYNGRGLEIYQVSVDPDVFAWRQAAANLPWVTVWNSPDTDGDKYLRQYNVSMLPTSFILTPSGDIVERIDDASKLDAAVARHI